MKSEVKKTELVKSGVKNWFGSMTNKKRLIVLMSLLLASFLMLLLTYSATGWLVKKFERSSSFLPTDVIFIIDKDNPYIQTFETNEEKLALKSFTVRVVTNATQPKGNVIVNIHSESGVLYSQTIDARAFRDWSVREFVFDKPQVQSSFTVEIRSELTEGFIGVANYHNTFCPNNISFQLFALFFTLAIIPLLLLAIIKLKLFKGFLSDSGKLQLVDILLFAAFGGFMFFSFLHSDIVITSHHGYTFLELLFEGKATSFYAYSSQFGDAVYDMPTYFIFAIWNLPIFIMDKILGTVTLSTVLEMQLWNKLLPVLFYAGMTFVIYKILIQLKMNKEKAKWGTFIFAVSPIGYFSPLIFAQYDTFGAFFSLLAVLFLLKKQYYKFSIFAGIAISLKMFFLFPLIPLLLLVQKNPLGIIKHLAIALSITLVVGLIFPANVYDPNGEWFVTSIIARVVASGLSSGVSSIAFTLIALSAASLVAYKTVCKDDEEFGTKVIYIVLFVYSALFIFATWNPQWLVNLAPWLVISLMMAKNQKMTFLLLAIATIGYYLLIPDIFANNVDQNITGLMFKEIFGSRRVAQLSIGSIYTYFGMIPRSILYSIFSIPLLFNLIINYPTTKRISEYRECAESHFELKREMIWVYGLLGLLFVAPAVWMYFI